MRTVIRCSCLLLLFACDPADEASRTGIVGPGTLTSGTVNTSEFIPHAFGVGHLQFGFDAERQVAMPVTGWDGEAQIALPIELQVQILNEAALVEGFQDGVNGCSVVLQRTDEVPVAAWTEGAGAWFAFEVSESTGSQTCGMLDFPDDWGSNPADHVIKWAWGGGLQPVTADAIEIMGDDWPAWEPWVVGGGYWWQELPVFTGGTAKGGTFDPDGYIDAGIAEAFRLDKSGALERDGEGELMQIPAAELDAGQLVTAWYDVRVVRYLTPARRLLESPAD